MTERTVPSSVMTELERSSSPDALIWFMKIDHSSLKDPIRVVADEFDYLISGVTWQKALFTGKALSDTDQSPSAEIRVPNVSRVIGRALENADSPATVQAFVYSTAEFDLTKDPREPTGTPTKIYEFQHMQLVNVEVNAAEITGRLRLHDYSTEPWPSIRATQDRFPGLFA